MPSDNVIQVVVNDFMREWITDEAWKSRMSVSAFVRDLLEAIIEKDREKQSRQEKAEK